MKARGFTVTLSTLGAVLVAAVGAMGLDGAGGAKGATAAHQRGDGQGRRVTFRGFLTGAEENPPVATQTTGRFKIKFSRDASEADFELRVRDGVAVTQAHLHCGPVGANGPVVAFLFGMIPGGFDADGKIADFTLTDANITGLTPDCQSRIGFNIRSIADLLRAMEDGNIYVNLHTVANPGGEVRAQLVTAQRGGGNHDDDDEDDD